MTVFAALAASWCITAVATVLLGRLDGVFTPHWLVRVLTGGAVLFAVATTMSSVAAICVVVTAPTVFGVVIAVALTAWVLVGCWRAARHGLRVSERLRAGKVFRDSSCRAGDMLIIDDDLPDAFAVPGRAAVVVVTTGLRAALSEDEFDAVVRHERAHLRARHHRYIHATELAGCFNPLLLRWPDAVRFAAERHADECAAQHDRRVVVRALARAALVCTGPSAALATTLPIVDDAGDVVRRVRALQRPRPTGRRGWAVAVAIVLAATAANVVMTADLIQDRLAPEPCEAASVVLR